MTYRSICFVLTLILSGQVNATDSDITNPERLKATGILIRNVGYTCTPVKVFDTGVIHGKQFYRVKCQDGQRYLIATPHEGKINDVDTTGAAYIAVDELDWQKSEWINKITRNTESLDNISKSYPDILE